MKKFLCLILSLIMLVSVCACGKDGEENYDDPGVESTEQTWLDRQFAEAEELYAWFTGCGAPERSASDMLEADGAMYARVLEPGLTSLEALETRLNTYFTEDIVLSLMETEVFSGAPVFRDMEGGLYYCVDMSGEIPWDIGTRSGFILSQSNTEILYHVEISLDYYGSLFWAEHDYHLVPGTGGKWCFDSFRLPAALIAEQMFQPDHVEDEAS